MKKQVITIFILLTSLSCCAQMQRQNYVGEPFNYVTYTAPANKLWVIIQPGQGAASNDITTIGNIGYGRTAQAKTLPFNVLIVQAKKGKSIDDYTPISKNWSKTFANLGIKYAILTGYSLGGQEAIRQIWVDHSGVFVGFVPMCGQYPYGPEPELKADVISKVPVLLLHGDKDASISWYQSNTVNNMINKVHASQSSMVIIPGGSHSDAWNKGYDIQSDYGKIVYNFILSLIPKDPKPIQCSALLDTLKSTAVFTLPDGTLYKSTLIKQ